MEEAKKRKLNLDASSPLPPDASSLLPSQQDMKKLLEPLKKDQLIDLLVKLGSQYTAVAEEITSVASAYPIHRKLFVRGLSWDTTSATLCDAFRVHGEIEEGAVIADKVTGKSRGYGFITYRSLESTLSALRESSKLIDGRMVACNLACEGLNGGTVTPDQAQRKLYIGGLSPDISSETLLHFFGRHGEIEEGSVAYEKDTNKSRGFGFVTYKTAEAVRKAIDDPNKILGGRNITVKLADTQKSRTVQTPIPAGMVPFAVPIPGGYAEPGNPHIVNPPVAYSPYPLATYPHTGFPNHSPASLYPAQTQMSYAPFAVKNDHVGLPAGPPAGVGGYPYYTGNQ